MSILDDIIETKDITLQQILNNLLDGTKDLDLKTHIFKPKQLASLVVFSNYLKTFKLKKSYNLLDSFIQKYLRYMISFKRLSRTEIIKAFSKITEVDDNLSTSKKLTSNMK